MRSRFHAEILDDFLRVPRSEPCSNSKSPPEAQLELYVLRRWLWLPTILARGKMSPFIHRWRASWWEFILRVESSPLFLASKCDLVNFFFVLSLDTTVKRSELLSTGSWSRHEVQEPHLILRALSFKRFWVKRKLRRRRSPCCTNSNDFLKPLRFE